MNFPILTIIIAAIFLYFNTFNTIKKINNSENILSNNILGSILFSYIIYWIFICLFARNSI